MSAKTARKPKDHSSTLVTLMEALRKMMAQKATDPDAVLVLWSAVRTTARLCDVDEKLQEKLDDLDCRIKKPYGITDAIRSILFLSSKPMRPTEIRDALIAIHFDMRKYTFPMASVHSSIKRLAKRGEATALALGDESFVYRWNRDSCQVLVKTQIEKIWFSSLD